MTLSLFALLLFVGCLGLTLSALYFLIEAPAARRRLERRLATIGHARSLGPPGALLRPDADEGADWRGVLRKTLRLVPGVEWLATCMRQGAVEVTVGVLLLMCASLAALALLLSWVVALPVPVPALAALAAGCAPVAVVAARRARRLARFEAQFPDAIDMLSRAVQAGHAVTAGFELIAKEMPEPVASELQIVYDQQNLGLPLRDALANLAARMPLPDVRFFATAVQIQRESGGNLSEILEKLAYVMRERFKLLRQVRVYTAEGRLSLYILTAVPPLTGLLMLLTNREYVQVLFHDPLGQRLLTAAVVLQVAGYFVIRQITRLKV
jgi:tight adherence protein B